MAHRDPTDNWAYLETAPDGTEYRIVKNPDGYRGTIWNLYEVGQEFAIHTFNLKREAIEWINS